MEIRANYIIVGVFTLAILLGGFVFTLWVTKQSQRTVMAEYDISFKESVRGLSVSSDVLFTGIKVGTVNRIKISDKEPGVVSVRISIAADTPVRENSAARLEIQGVTGTTLVSISGGTATSPLVRLPQGQVGEIRSEPSPLSAVMAHIPNTVAAANEVLHRLDSMLSTENQESLTVTLAALAKLSSSLADKTGALNEIVNNTQNTSRQLSSLTEEAGKDLKATSESMSRIAARIDSTLTVAEPGLKQFSREGLSDVRMLVVETRNLVHVFTRIAQKLESDPRRFLFGEPVQEYKSR